MKRKKFSKEFKAKVALEALKGNKTVNELATEYETHSTQINIWKKELQQGAGEIFSGSKGKEVSHLEAEKSRLFEQIGCLQVEVDWLKKRPDISIKL